MQEEFVIVLEVMVLPHPDNDSYLSYRENKITRKQWFDDEVVVGKMRYDITFIHNYRLKVARDKP